MRAAKGITSLGAVTMMLTGCGRTSPVAPTEVPVTQAFEASMVPIAGGPFARGSNSRERDAAYALYRATAGHGAARQGGWFDREASPTVEDLTPFTIDAAHVTNASYSEFVSATGHRSPAITAADWKAQGFSQQFASEVSRFNWTGSAYPTGRGNHPVVLVSHADATSYCAWRERVFDKPRMLPSAAEFERAARGAKGRTHPWGDEFDPSRLNSVVNGPNDTTQVRAHPGGRTPEGVYDLSGNAFQWTRTPWISNGRMTVKGSAWDDFGGVGRGAARHGRAPEIRHAIVGFRCVGR